VLSRATLATFANAERRRPGRMPLLARIASPADRNLLRDVNERYYLAHIVDEAFRQGTAQVAHEAALLQSPWDYWLADVKAAVNIIGGCQDGIAPPVMAKYLAARLPNARLTLYPGEAHMSLGRLRAGDLLDGAILAKEPAAISAQVEPSSASRREQPTPRNAP